MRVQCTRSSAGTVVVGDGSIFIFSTEKYWQNQCRVSRHNNATFYHRDSREIPLIR